MPLSYSFFFFYFHLLALKQHEQNRLTMKLTCKMLFMLNTALKVHLGEVGEQL